jgi:hypothetical protein
VRMACLNHRDQVISIEYQMIQKANNRTQEKVSGEMMSLVMWNMANRIDHRVSVKKKDEDQNDRGKREKKQQVAEDENENENENEQRNTSGISKIEDGLMLD